MILLRPFLLALGVTGGCCAHSFAEDLSASKVKTAFVLNFAKFTQWPSKTAGTTDESLLLCVIGNDVLDGEINQLKGKKAGKRFIEIQQHTHHQSSNFEQCDIAFIGRSEQNQLNALFKNFNRSNILTISDINNFASQGGHVELKVKGNNIVFEINLQTLQANQLRLPSQVLNLAANVIK